MTPGRQRGSLLLEVLVALAIFVAAGLAILTLVDRSSRDLARLKLIQQAADLSRSAMSRIEAGLASPESLSGPVRVAEAKSESTNQPSTAGPGPAPGWELEIDTEPAAVTGLTLVSVRAVLRAETPGQDDRGVSYTLRQYVDLRRSVTPAS